MTADRRTGDRGACGVVRERKKKNLTESPGGSIFFLVIIIIIISWVFGRFGGMLISTASGYQQMKTADIREIEGNLDDMIR